MAARVHRQLKAMAFNANDIWKWRYELSKQQQDLHIDAALLSETHLKPHERFFIPNYHFCWTDCYQVRKGVSHNHVHQRRMYVQYVPLVKEEKVKPSL
jgi:hypothetical protein